MADADEDQHQNAGSFLPKHSPVGQVIQIRDLAHIQSLARADLVTGNGPGILNDPPLQQMKYDIHKMPINDIIQMVASLLHKITETNDLQHDAIQRNATHQQQGESGNGGISPLSSSVLAFHGKNIPAISIHNYLSRIHRYCPTTYEVFLSLLVYFDRMTERVNDMVMKSEQARQQVAVNVTRPIPSTAHHPSGTHSADELHHDQDDSESVESDSDLADDDEDEEMGGHGGGHDATSSHVDVGKVISGTTALTVATGPATYFVVDSFNIHRLIIAGVTCASKFFSDVFYTNSRYAKVSLARPGNKAVWIGTNGSAQVGGLPLTELNHLELQFLLLNDFQLFIPVEDLDAYATMLVEFYARELQAQESQSAGLD
jgi:PHO85 cyclin-6/7